MRARMLILSSAIGGLAVLGTLELRGRARETEALRREVTALRGAIDARAVAPPAPRSSIAPAAVPEPKAAAPAAPPPEPKVEHKATRFDGVPREELPAHVAELFEREPVDRAWAAETGAKVKADAAKLSGAIATIEDVQCRSLSCRIRATFPDAEARMDFLHQGFQQARDSAFYDLNYAMYAPPPVEHPDGQLEADVYLFSDGW
jgi:hypothetical protein